MQWAVMDSRHATHVAASGVNPCEDAAADLLPSRIVGLLRPGGIIAIVIVLVGAAPARA